jgi:YegS/Rv2252/BmrU family lipid kinase
MSPVKSLFVVNPVSDFGRTLEIWKEARLVLPSLGLEFTEFITSGSGQATAVTRQAIADGVCQIVAVGGDGTLNEVVNGYLNTDGKPVKPGARLGLLPSGTGSDFKKTIGIKNARAALDSLASDNTTYLDAGRADYTTAEGKGRSRFFINLVSIGLGGDVSGFVNAWRAHLPKWIGGKARFSLAAIRALGRYRNAEVDLVLDSARDLRSHSVGNSDLDNGRRLRVSSNLIVVGNGRFAGGGMLLAPDACPDDGFLDLVTTDGASRLDVIRELPRIRRGGYIKNPKVSARRVRGVSIVGDRALPLDIDGESEGWTPVTLTVVPSAVRFAL